MTASIAAFQTFQRVYSGPATENQPLAFGAHRSQYDLFWAYHNNSVFDDIGSWAIYKQRHNLYRYIRSIYNPTNRLNRFYAANVWPGALSEDGSDLPDGVQLAIPFSKDTDKKIKRAVAQLWQWWNFQSLKSVIPLTGAGLGSVLIELVDDQEKGKVTFERVWPGYVVELELDVAGNITRYVLEYQTTDKIFSFGGMKPEPNPLPYVYRKEVDKYAFRYFKDNKPFDYDGDGAVQPHPYGFVPARWIKHLDEGGSHGIPAIAGSLSKIDELNQLASQLSNYVGKAIESPKILWGAGPIARLNAKPQSLNIDRGFLTPADIAEAVKDKQSINILQGPAGGHADDLITSLDISAVLESMDRIIGEIENDHPELEFYKQLRSMSSLTGPAASRIMGDTDGLLRQSASNYDQSIISIFQMALAICGMRLKEGNGGWANPTDQQKKFKYFDLSSYQAGKLDMAIMPRSLIQSSKTEQAQERLTFYQSIKAAQDAGLPFEKALEDAGFDQTQIDEIMQLKDAKAAKAQAIFQPNNSVGQFNSPDQPAQLPAPNQSPNNNQQNSPVN